MRSGGSLGIVCGQSVGCLGLYQGSTPLGEDPQGEEGVARGREVRMQSHHRSLPGEGSLSALQSQNFCEDFKATT